MNEIRQYDYWEHLNGTIPLKDIPSNVANKLFGDDSKRFCYKCSLIGEEIKLEAGYFIGVDWLVEGHSVIVVSPKLNTRIDDIIKKEQLSDVDSNVEVDTFTVDYSLLDRFIAIDYSAMLLQCLSTDFLYEEIERLIHIDWKADTIPIAQEQDWLSPLLISQYLSTLNRIVRKGLRRSYYKTSRNLKCKIKGKVAMGQHVKQNIFKNSLSSTFCEFEEYGIDSPENRLLKRALLFAQSYLDNHKAVFNKGFPALQSICRYVAPAFEEVSDEVSANEVSNYKPNPFFKEYKQAIQQAKLIFKRYAYSLSHTSADIITTPPYWIDMPKLFELYVYSFLKNRFPAKKELTYHFRTLGNELDFLINTKDIKMVVDAKYKPIYIYGKNSHDMRQVSGYSRLKIIYEELGMEDDRLIDCLIVYPDILHGCDMDVFSGTDLKSKLIKEYRNIYKIGIKIPIK